ncbi:putative periplasmic protein YibQ [Halorhodospira halochloris]|uniref:Periplasmic protein YibQ n=1 Tax=Halorhodospira halochloris TaxID=1052 RepID=A0A0X8X823_HALHR|nr:divergent polysaccharide deacetylase family protein [Halorhodospira halochloris]BAU56688.2 putative periplasmic protein YibQ [Halorhodospira halochloris]
MTNNQNAIRETEFAASNKLPWKLFMLLLLVAGLSAARAELEESTVSSDEVENGEYRLAALIIDDIGDLRQPGIRAINLPANVAISVLPHTPFGTELAELAHEQGREVMLHMPMEAKNRTDPGPGAIYLDMDEHDVRRAMRAALADVPHARGVNNHMGSLITRHPGHMQWVMEELKRAGDLYFIDSRTSARSVAQELAKEYGLKNSARVIFIDPQRDEEIIEKQIKDFIATAHSEDGAIAIGHPYPETLDLLEEYLPKLRGKGIKLVPPSVLVDKPAGDPVEEMHP